jgi:AGCS family alanine or glycine:cation symporter
MSLAGVGTGNIAGVLQLSFWRTWSYALDVDGCFWSKYRFVEATLAQIYKEKHLGQFRGGPAFYREVRRVNGLLFCFMVSIISAGVLLPGVQVCCRRIQNA